MGEFNDKFAGMSEEQRQQRYHQLALACLEHYPVQVEGIRCVGHNAGVAYHIETPQRPLLLKIAQPAGEVASYSPESIRAGLLWLDNLARQTDLTVQQPLTNHAGELLTSVNFHDLTTPFYCSLQHWLDGEHPREPSPKQAHLIGVMMAKLHNHASQWTPPRKLPTYDSDPASLKKWLDGLSIVVDWGILSSSAWAVVEAASQRIFAMMQTLGKEPSVWGSIHGDLHHDNIIFKDDEPRPIDFGSLRAGHFAYDLGVTLYHFMYLDVSVRQALMAGYQVTRTGTQLPHMAAEAFLCAAALENLAFQVMLPSERNSPLFIRNTHEFADVFCRKLVDNVPFALV